MFDLRTLSWPETHNFFRLPPARQVNSSLLWLHANFACRCWVRVRDTDGSRRLERQTLLLATRWTRKYRRNKILRTSSRLRPHTVRAVTHSVLTGRNQLQGYWSLFYKPCRLAYKHRHQRPCIWSLHGHGASRAESSKSPAKQRIGTDESDLRFQKRRLAQNQQRPHERASFTSYPRHSGRGVRLSSMGKYSYWDAASTHPNPPGSGKT